MSGVALKLPRIGGSPSRQRRGSWRFSSANTSRGGPDHSPPPGSVTLSRASGVGTRHATRSDAKLAPVIWASGEYFELARSPP